MNNIHIDRRSGSERKLSIVVPVYNTSLYLIDTLNSIIASLGDESEIIVVNDGSTDNSLQLILDWIETHNFNVCVVSKPNGGLGAARNTGIEFTKGKYIAFFDSDDYAISYSYKEMVKLAENNTLDMVIARAKCFKNANLQEFEFGDYNIINSILGEKNFVITSMYRDGRIFRIEPSVVTRIYNRQFFIDNIKSFPENLLFEDLVPHFNSIISTTRIGILNEYLLLYRVGRQGQITSSRGATRLDIIDSVAAIANSPRFSQLPSKSEIHLISLIVRMVIWCGVECPRALKAQFTYKLLNAVEHIPNHMWDTYGQSVTDNDREKLFCSLIKYKNEAGLIRFFDNQPQKLTFSSVRSERFSLFIKIARKIKTKIVPFAIRKVRFIKRSLQ